MSAPTSTARASNGGRWSATASGSSLTVSTTGTTWVQFRAVDKAGNASAWALAVPDDPSATANIDKVLPTVPPVDWCGCMVEGRVRGRHPDRRVDRLRRLGSRGPYDFRTSTSLNPDKDGQLRQLDHGLGRGQDRGGVPKQRRGRQPLGVVGAGGGVARPHRADDRDLHLTRPAGVGLEQHGHDRERRSQRRRCRRTTLLYRLGTSGAGSASTGSVLVSTQGTTVVEFQATDALGNASAWTAPTTV